MLPLILSLSLISPAIATAAAPRPRSVITRGEGYVRASINPITNIPRLRRRATEVAVANHDLGTQYAIDVGIGTPPQTLTLVLDTGSPDLWINPTCATANQPKKCTQYPQFDYTKSSTLQVSDYVDILRYGKGNATIQYVSDTVTIGSIKIKEQILGYGLESYDIPLGILGLSPAINPNGADNYPYVLDTMAAQGVIKSRAFSLDLRSVSEPTGAIIFGGLDTGKFVGALQEVPILDPSTTPGGSDRYWITLTGIGITLPDGSSDRSGEIQVPVFPDSGGTLSRLPTPIFQAFGEAFPTAQFDSTSGFWIVDCAATKGPGSVDFYFGKKRIAVAFADFVWEVQQGTCVLGVLVDDEEPVLGDSFLRAAYVVHDQDNRVLHLAQAANCGENIVAIGSGTKAVPSVTGDCSGPATPTAVNAGALDATATRAPTNIFSGTSPDATGVVGPGPFGGGGGRTTTTAGLSQPKTTGKSGAGRGVGLSVGLGAAMALVAAVWAM